jgi:hypothetical protein
MTVPHRSAALDAAALELDAAYRSRCAGELERAFTHLERAHVLGQRLTWVHVQAHLGMLQIGWARRDFREVTGQLLRILFSRIWVPIGNTGGANVPAMKPMPISADLRAILERDEDILNRSGRGD